MKEQVFKQDAKSIVDILFDKKWFVDSVTRDDMNLMEELLGYMLQSRYEGYIKAKELLDRLK